ncbi:KTSC domain-containing protein [Actinokineospora iranica]|uniref:KTSC domain-containing protein n=1 Tax=Actinokineospora iranica TaxID=1271860 RepID=A0A1G6TQF6_9PSEU|nr:KTSC domain-containing protein [Actinokineospora iranica]SDD31338.1 KTSC domain-containing protein [Actinokineospora iranica]
MDRMPVSSSTVASVGYDATRRILEVEFRNGGVYQYLDVPKKVYWQFVSAKSPGTYLNGEIKDAYDTRKVT